MSRNFGEGEDDYNEHEYHEPRDRDVDLVSKKRLRGKKTQRDQPQKPNRPGSGSGAIGGFFGGAIGGGLKWGMWGMVFFATLGIVPLMAVLMPKHRNKILTAGLVFTALLFVGGGPLGILAGLAAMAVGAIGIAVVGAVVGIFKGMSKGRKAPGFTSGVSVGFKQMMHSGPNAKIAVEKTLRKAYGEEPRKPKGAESKMQSEQFKENAHPSESHESHREMPRRESPYREVLEREMSQERGRVRDNARGNARYDGRRQEQTEENGSAYVRGFQGHPSRNVDRNMERHMERDNYGRNRERGRGEMRYGEMERERVADENERIPNVTLRGQSNRGGDPGHYAGHQGHEGHKGYDEGYEADDEDDDDSRTDRSAPR